MIHRYIKQASVARITLRNNSLIIESKSVYQAVQEMIRSQFPSIPIQELAWIKEVLNHEPKTKRKSRQFNSLKSWDLLHQTHLDSILQRLHSSFVCPLKWSLDYILHCFPILKNLIFTTLPLIHTITFTSNKGWRRDYSFSIQCRKQTMDIIFQG
jgi:hypothetical protein